MSDDLIKLHGTVTRVFKGQRPEWTAGRILPVSAGKYGCDEPFVGNCYVSEEEEVVLVGRYVNDKKWGRQFQVDHRTYEIPFNEMGLARWLDLNLAAKGIGAKKGEKIAAEFGENWTEVLRNDPEQIAIFAGVSIENIQALRMAWFDHLEFNNVATQLCATYQLTNHQIQALYQRYKGSILDVLAENPYVLVGQVESLGFGRVDEIAKSADVPDTHPGRYDAAIIHNLSGFANDGSTCVDETTLARETLALLGHDNNPEAITRLELSFGRLMDKNQLALTGHPLRYFSLLYLWRFEHYISTFLAGTNTANPLWTGQSVTDLVLDFREVFTPRLDDSQMAALHKALCERVSLISGGAGVGKTLLIRALTQFYQRENLRVRLCAPTGKAARRIEEVVGHSAQTIHRMLGYGPRFFGSNNDVSGWPEQPMNLCADVVIADEMSMATAEIAYHLFRSVEASNANLVLVGDHFQLPPVGPGSLLRDCIDHQLIPQTVLKHCHRQAGPLKTNCSALLDGKVEPSEKSEQPPWICVRRLDDPDSLLAALEELWKTQLRKVYNVDPLQDVQIMTPVHKGVLGTYALNVMLQQLCHKGSVPRPEPGKPPRLHAGDRVICLKNDYENDVMNGHQGICVAPEPNLAVNFDGRTIRFKEEYNKKHDRIALSYALTIHKMQGSQVPIAVVICHSKHRFMLHRHLLYTACTRATLATIILGDDVGVSYAAKTIKLDQRKTLLPLLFDRKAVGQMNCPTASP
jgi:exodeoxyribonuclease V alpha subunit